MGPLGRLNQGWTILIQAGPVLLVDRHLLNTRWVAGPGEMGRGRDRVEQDLKNSNERNASGQKNHKAKLTKGCQAGINQQGRS